MKTSEKFTTPFPHETGVGFFPEDLYAEMLKNLPEHSEYKQYHSYPSRYLYKAENGFWKEIFDYVRAPYPGLETSVQLMRDLPGYSIGPHTDAPKKIKTCLFYLTDKEVEGAGTCLFVPKMQGFESSTGAHYDFDGFTHVKTVPYVPNGYFTFERTNNSFHGVIETKVVRNILQLAVFAR